MKCLHVTKIGSLKDPNPEARGAVGILDIPEQPLGDEDIRIKVAYCSICGSDPHLAEGIFGTDVPIPLGRGRLAFRHPDTVRKRTRLASQADASAARSAHGQTQEWAASGGQR